MARASGQKEGTFVPRPPGKGVKIEPRTVRRVRLARALGRAPVEVLTGRRGSSPPIIAVTVVGAAPATFVYAYPGERAPQYTQALLIAFGTVIAGAVVAAVFGAGGPASPCLSAAARWSMLRKKGS